MKYGMSKHCEERFLLLASGRFHIDAHIHITKVQTTQQQVAVRPPASLLPLRLHGKSARGKHMFQQALSNTPRGVVMFQSRNRVRARTRQWHALGSRAELPGFGNIFQRLAGDIEGVLVFRFPCSTCILRVLPSRIPANVGSAWNTNRPTGPAAGIESPDLADVSCRWPQTQNPCHGLGCSHPLFFGTLFW